MTLKQQDDRSPEYRLTEEVVRQTVEVAFLRDPRWRIAFSNPTAGPWKRIKIGQYVTGADLRYAKEEDRPDLIAYSPSDHAFLVFEAKDDVRKLLVSEQHAKSMAVFQKEIARIEKIVQAPDTALLALGSSPRPCCILPGYIFPVLGPKFDQSVGALKQLHFASAKVLQQPSLTPCICLVVGQDEQRNLTTEYLYWKQEDASHTALPQALLPSGIACRQ